MTLNVIVDELLEGAERAKGTEVIVDILRATSQLSTLFELGSKEIYLAQNIEEAEKLKGILEKEGKNILIGGETGGKTPKDFDFSNSPLLVYNKFKDILLDNTVVYTSTNGVNGILSAKKSDEIITASFLNYRAIVDYLKQTKPEKITIVGMGEFGESSVEDKSFSIFLKDTLIGKPTNLNKIKDDIYNCDTVKFMREYFGKGIDKDIEFCLNTDMNFNVVPRLYTDMYGSKLLDALKQK